MGHQAAPDPGAPERRSAAARFAGDRGREQSVRVREADPWLQQRARNSRVQRPAHPPVSGDSSAWPLSRGETARSDQTKVITAFDLWLQQERAAARAVALDHPAFARVLRQPARARGAAQRGRPGRTGPLRYGARSLCMAGAAAAPHRSPPAGHSPVARPHAAVRAGLSRDGAVQSQVSVALRQVLARYRPPGSRWMAAACGCTTVRRR